uniref:Alpha/beta hydrolase n=1 Tax=Toxocara canis TaxID=6265 RepID=A0A183U4L2_TOXCA
LLIYLYRQGIMQRGESLIPKREFHCGFLDSFENAMIRNLMRLLSLSRWPIYTEIRNRSKIRRQPQWKKTTIIDLTRVCCMISYVFLILSRKKKCSFALTFIVALVQARF